MSRQQFLAGKLKDGFEVERLREQINQMRLFHAVACRRDWREIARERGWIARNIGHAGSGDAQQAVYDACPQATPWRINDDQISVHFSDRVLQVLLDRR